ncbi:hypothetical protein GGR56DRAFT_677840 [Xylariaceae sp. FL0804]|nr:hypothetical protein GGR56DRAFT_677840 [Xylariaceae sp. FL0804]
MDAMSAPEHRPRGPRLYHKKSRTGCLRCKQRRVKCDEIRPSCGSCSRHVVECVYPSQAAAPSVNGRASAASAAAAAAAAASAGATAVDAEASESKAAVLSAIAAPSAARGAPAPSKAAPYAASGLSLSPHASDAHLAQSPRSSSYYPSPSSSHATSQEHSAETDIDLPEGAWRRHWELRLLHNQQTKVVQPFSSPQMPEIVRMWTFDVPNMALTMAQQGRCGLLYIIFAQSALNMWSRSTDHAERDELIKLQQTYQLMCSKEQRRDIAELTQGNPQHADYTCLASLKILSHSLALVQTSSIDPWEPPTQWLHMGRGAGEVFDMARKLIDPNSDSYILRFINSPPVIYDPRDTILSDFTPLAWLLDHPSPGSPGAQADRELEDAEVRSVYERALAYTCSVQRAALRGEPEFAIVRRLGGFAVWMPLEFSRFVEERRPRALVILAHFMALWLDHEEVWILGRAGEWQIRCIHKNLPLEWSSKLDGLFAMFKQQPDAR